MDELNLKSIWRDFKGYFLRPPHEATRRATPGQFNLLRIYRHDIPLLLRQQALPFGMVMLGVAVATVAGVFLAQQYPLPPETFPIDQISAESFEQVERISFLPSISTTGIFTNNVRVLLLAAIFSIFSFGALTLLLALVNLGLVSFIIAEVVLMGINPWLFVATFILPHGILEIPALLIGLSFALKIGAGIMAPPNNLDVGQALLLNLANYTKMMIFLLMPLLLLAAFIEANLTPQLVLAVYGQ